MIVWEVKQTVALQTYSTTVPTLQHPSQLRQVYTMMLAQYPNCCNGTDWGQKKRRQETPIFLLLFIQIYKRTKKVLKSENVVASAHTQAHTYTHVHTPTHTYTGALSVQGAQGVGEGEVQKGEPASLLGLFYLLAIITH